MPYDPCSKGDVKHTERKQRAEDTYNAIQEVENLSPELFTEALAGDLGPSMGKLYGQLIVRHNLWETAIRLSQHADPKIAFRSSWALANAYEKNRAYFAGDFSHEFLETYLESTNGSVQRSFSKILCDMLRRKLISPDIETQEKIAEKTFGLLIDTETKVAVKVWAMEILFDMAPEFDWVNEYLEDVIRTELQRECPAPAMISHGKKVLRRLKDRQGTNHKN